MSDEPDNSPPQENGTLRGGSLALASPEVLAEFRPDGAIVLAAPTGLRPLPGNAAAPILDWAAQAPHRTALADRGGGGDWRRLSYRQLADMSARVAQGFLDLGLSPGRPILLIGRNRLEAAVVTLAALRAGVPVAPVTPAYAARNADSERLEAVLETLDPGLILLDDGLEHAPPVKQARLAGATVMTFGRDFERLAETAPAAAALAVQGSLGPETVAKILFTSGSTGSPKGVINTHRMLAANAQALRQAWPFVEEEAPIVVDWLPWNHTFGGNFVMHSLLTFGGSLYVDDGKPVEGEIERSVRNAAEIGPNVHLNVPRGLDMVMRVLAADAGLAREFFARLGLVFFASSGLPARIRSEWLRLIDRFGRREVRFCSAWGSTETAPLATTLNFEAPEVNNIGVPVAGVTVKLAPAGGRFELRVRGANVMPAYLNRPVETAAAFDEEGYFRTGDLGRLADPARPERGLLIEGRLAEDFKLATGVWVHAGRLRNELLELIGPVAREVVISGPDRNELAALIFLDVGGCQAIGAVADDHAGLASDAAVQAHLAGVFARYNAGAAGSSRAIAAFAAARRNLDAAAGEITEKGAVNSRAVLVREVALFDELHARSRRK